MLAIFIGDRQNEPNASREFGIVVISQYVDIRYQSLNKLIHRYCAKPLILDEYPRLPLVSFFSIHHSILGCRQLKNV